MTRHTCLHTRVQYRLCPADQPLTEACFSKTPLQFNTGKQQLQWNNGTRLHGVISSVSTYIYSYLLIYLRRTPISGTFITSGVLPAASTWAMNPIPPRCLSGNCRSAATRVTCHDVSPVTCHVS